MEVFYHIDLAYKSSVLVCGCATFSRDTEYLQKLKYLCVCVCVCVNPGNWRNSILANLLKHIVQLVGTSTNWLTVSSSV